MITVVNKRKGGKGIYIGRGNKHTAGSVLGNPFKMKHEGDRDRVVEAYRIWLESQLKLDGEVKQEIRRIADLSRAGRQVNLVCWCAPKRCHGDIVKEVVEGILSAEQLQVKAGFGLDSSDSPIVCHPVQDAGKKRKSISTASRQEFPPLGSTVQSSRVSSGAWAKRTESKSSRASTSGAWAKRTESKS